MKNIVFIIILFFVKFSYAASFDCKKAKTDIEKTICHNSDLNDLDRLLSEKYFSLKNSLQNDEVGALVSEQKVWLSNREKGCNDKEMAVSCLVTLYKERIEVLRDRLDPCPEELGLSQQGNCMSADSLGKSERELEKKVNELIGIFDKHTKEGNENFNFELFKAALITSQKSWLQYINDQCVYLTAIDATSSGHAGIEYHCQEQHTKERIKFIDGEIKEWLDGSLN